MTALNIINGTSYFIQTNGGPWFLDMVGQGPDVTHYPFSRGDNQKWTAIKSVDQAAGNETWMFMNNHNHDAYMSLNEDASLGFPVVANPMHSKWYLTPGSGSNVYRISSKLALENQTSLRYISWSQDDSKGKPFVTDRGFLPSWFHFIEA